MCDEQKLHRAAVKDKAAKQSYGYYPDGKLRYAIGGGMRYDYLYDVMGRLSKKSVSGRTLLLNEYDLNGNRTAVTDLTGKRSCALIFSVTVPFLFSLLWA